MTVPKIGAQTGITAVTKKMAETWPGNAAGVSNFRKTQEMLVAGHNEGLDRLAALESKVAPLPFLRP